jgi:hypothetical protein
MADRIGYRLIEPPGWVHLAVDEPHEAQVASLATLVAAASAPEVRPGLEALVRRQLSETLSGAADRGGQDVFMPTQLVNGLALPMTIIVAGSPRPPGGAGRGPSDALLAYASRHEGAQAKEIDGALAVRSVEQVAAIPGTKDATRLLDSRRITYLVAAPTASERMMVITCSILRYEFDTEGEMIDAMEFLFDSIVGTVRFERAPASTEVIA